MKTVGVFGGGGVKGMGHAGAWRAILEAGIEPDEIIGTSIGGLVGACVAGGASWERVYEQARELTKVDIVVLNRWTLLLNGIRQTSVFQAEPLREYIERVLPVTEWSELKLPLSMNAVDLESGAEVWFGAGASTDTPMNAAIYATCALPLFYPPIQVNGSWLVDGGLVNGLPIDRAAERGAERIIAIDVGAGQVRDSEDTIAKGLIAIHHRTMEIVGWRRKQEMLRTWSGPQLVYVRPKLDGFSTFDFGQTEFFLEEGYRATREALGKALSADVRS